MRTIFSIVSDFRRFFNLSTRNGRLKSIILVAILVGGFLFVYSGNKDIPDIASQNRSVSTALVSSFSDSVTTQLVGTVASVDQAVIQSEISGRVTSVPVVLGQSVIAGQIIVQLENADEYALLLQAEGAYEVTLATAQSSDISLVEAMNAEINAKNETLSVYRNAYTTTSGVIYNTIDDFFSDPYHSTPGVNIDAGGQIFYLNDERVTFNQILPQWQVKSTSLTINDDLQASLVEAISYTSRAMQMVDVFIIAIEQQDSSDTLTPSDLSVYANSLSNARVSLNNTLSALDKSIVSLQNAEEVVKKAELGGTSSIVSVSNAQIKQALGSLKSAQANYNKTILRSPISGVLNTLDVKTGDFVNGFQTIAEIANNDALEVTTYVGQSDRDLVRLQQEVLIEGDIVGVINTIAGAVNPLTGKVEVKIQTSSSDLVNGDTVTVFLENDITTADSALVQVPLTAVKFTASAGEIFTIENGALIAHSVEIGSVRDVYIEIISGINLSDEIVVDSRGLSVGEKVTAIAD